MSQEKMDTLCGIEGFVFDDLEELMVEGVSPGICMNEGCEYTTQVEPDCTEGFCEECDTETVKALTELIMEGFLPAD